MADIFGDQPINDDVSFETLVGVDKKYKDVNDLAKAYVNADTHIEDLRRDLAQARAELDAKKNLPTADTQQQIQPDPAPSVPVQPQNREDLRTQLREELKSLTLEQTFEQNVQTTAQTLLDYFGDEQKAAQAIKTKAQELGVSVNWLRDSAARTPQGFYKIMGVNLDDVNRKNTSTPAPENEVRFDSTNRGNVKNYDYYKNLKKDNKAAYYSVAVQQEMQKQARELGDAFYT